MRFLTQIFHTTKLSARGWSALFWITAQATLFGTASIADTMVTTYQFDLPAGPLDKAIYAFSTLTGLSIVVDYSLTAGKTSAAVKDTVTAAIALDQLLANSDLKAQYTGPNTLTLVPTSPSTHEIHTSSSLREMLPEAIISDQRVIYFGDLQTAIKARLCHMPGDVFGKYKLALKLWLDPTGLIRQSEILHSSGDTMRDAMMVNVLNGLATHVTPPAALRQPITLMVLPRLPQKTGDCVIAKQTPRN